MEYILFKQNGDLVGLRGSLPKEEENLIAIEWFEDFVNITNPKLENGKIISGGILPVDVEALDKEYTQRISDLVTKHVQKFIIDGTPIPQEVIDEREELKKEFYELANKQLKR